MDPAVKVKTERPDEAEIREPAAKMVEANKAKALAASVAAARAPPGALGAVPPPGAGGQLGILNFLNRKPGATGATDQPRPPADAEKKTPAPDEASWKDHFGWDMLDKCHIPYIFRSGEKYVAVRMVKIKLLNKYLNYLHADIYSYTCIRSYYITEIEARLLNEINNRHYDGQFGREPFTQKDLVIRLSDAYEFYNFLDVCYNKLMRGMTNNKDKCGFIRINKESVVPYIVRDGQKFVPLFYFEGETDNLKLKADQLKGWDLSYLKFCCKVQGISNEVIASETYSVISLSDIKSYFPPGTEFEEYWSSEIMDTQLLISAKDYQANIDIERPLPKILSHHQDTDYTTIDEPEKRLPRNTKVKDYEKDQDLEKKSEKDPIYGHVDNTKTKFPPKFKYPSELFNMDMKPAGSSIRLRCVAEGNPTPNITWYKNKATPIMRSYFQPSYGKWSMALDELTKADDGNYTCTVCNELDCIEHTVVLHVQERIYTKPVLTKGVVNQTRLVGQTATFSCEFLSDMHLYVYWMYFTKEEIVYNETVVGDSKESIVCFDSNKIMVSENPQDKPEQLTLYNITKEDEGWYVCVALNTLGNTTAKGYLTVLEYDIASDPWQEVQERPASTAQHAAGQHWQGRHVIS